MSGVDQPEGTITVTDQARAERLARQLAGVTRQLELRIAAEEELRAQLDEEVHEGHGLRAELQHAHSIIADLQAEHDRLMRTKTMRLLRVPRAVYGHLLKRR